MEDLLSGPYASLLSCLSLPANLLHNVYIDKKESCFGGGRFSSRTFIVHTYRYTHTHTHT